MPTKPLTPCNYPRCMTRCEGPYCSHHLKALGAIDREERGSAAKRGYNARHRKWRLMVLARNPLCVRCLAEDKTSAATVADHVVPLDPKNPTGGDWSLDNGQGLCHAHHNQKTGAEKKAPWS